MKFRKTILAVAVAGVAAAPMVVSADTTLSGLVEVKIAGDDSEGDAGDPSFQAGDVRVAIATEQALNSGLTGYGNIQMNLDDLSSEGGPDSSQFDNAQGLDDTPDLGGATISSDAIYAGVKGDFGDIRVGEIPLGVEYGQLANDIFDIGAEVPGGISYTGSFGAVTAGLNFSPENDSDMIGAGVKFNVAGATIGLGFEDRADTAIFSAGAAYTIAGFSLAAHLWGADLDISDVGLDDEGNTITIPDSDISGIAIQGGYGIGNVSFGITYATLSTDGDVTFNNAAGDSVTVSDPDQTALRFDAAYDMGGGMKLSTRIQNTETEGGLDFGGGVVAESDDLVEYRVMLTKVF